MARTTDDILRRAEVLSRRFEEYDPRPEDERNRAAVAALREIVPERADAEAADAKRDGESISGG